MLLMPLDRRDEWFRFHALFAEMLRSELHRLEPAEEVELHRRASDWWAEHGDSDRAIHHAIEGDAFGRAGELLFTGVPEYITRGRNATVMRWLDRLGQDAVASDPGLSLTAAYAHINRGEGGLAEHWAAVSGSLMDGTTASTQDEALTAGLALVEATLARAGVEAMNAHTTAAAELLPGESPWLSVCCLLDGVGLHLRGFRDEARERLAEGSRRGAIGAPNVQVLCLAQLALLAIDEGDWQVAEMLASQGRAQIDRSGLGGYTLMALPLAVSALVRSHIGKVQKAAADLRLGTRLVGALDEFAPWYEAEARIVIARTAVRLGDAPRASQMLDEAGRLVKLTPDATLLGEWIEQTAATIENVFASAVRDLTPAELRVLQLLPTHLSFPEIAAQAFVSPNTVKTQAQAVYRKLGVSSRREAVERARAAGLLDGDGSSQDPSAR
jgi:LuxR family maltose regulon positive regulatory protein